MKGLLERTKISPELVEDIIVGNVLAHGGGAVISRMAAFHAGYNASILKPLGSPSIQPSPPSIGNAPAGSRRSPV